MFRPRFLLFFALILNLATQFHVAYCQTSNGITGWEPKTLAFEVEEFSPSQSPFRPSRGDIVPSQVKFDIFVIDFPGSKPRKLVEGAHPALSPDGTQIAYCIQTAHHWGQLQVINTDGSGQRQLTNIAGGGVCSPEWSPDGENLAFTVVYGMTRAIYTAAKNGDKVTRITDGGAAHWSPDGAHIVFIRYPEAHGTKASIWVAIADGSDARMVFEDTNLSSEPAWYPDGRSIVFASTREHMSAIFRLNLDGTNLTEIARDDKMAFLYPVFSPDSKQLLVTAVNKSNPEPSIVLLDMASHQGKRVLHGPWTSSFLYPSVLWVKK